MYLFIIWAQNVYVTVPANYCRAESNMIEQAKLSIRRLNLFLEIHSLV